MWPHTKGEGESDLFSVSIISVTKQVFFQGKRKYGHEHIVMRTTELFTFRLEHVYSNVRTDYCLFNLR